MCRTELVGSSVAEAVNLEQGDLFHIFLYVKAPRGGEWPDRPSGKIRPSDRDPITTDERESYYFRILNKIYLKNLLHGWVVNHGMNLISIFNS